MCLIILLKLFDDQIWRILAEIVYVQYDIQIKKWLLIQVRYRG